MPHIYADIEIFVFKTGTKEENKANITQYSVKDLIVDGKIKGRKVRVIVEGESKVQIFANDQLLKEIE